MIRLEVAPYCENCQLFDADVEYPQKMIAAFEEILIGDTIIRCAHRRLCNNIKNYLERGDSNDLH